MFWLLFGPGLMIGWLLLAALLIRLVGHQWPATFFICSIGGVLTLWVTWAVATDLAQKISFNRRLKRPNRPPLRMLRLTIVCFLIQMLLLVAAPFIVYGLMIMLMD